MKKHFRTAFILLVSVLIFALCAMTAFAAAVADGNEIDISNATPDEIEEIGMGAMIEAGLVSESDITVQDVTPAPIAPAPQGESGPSGVAIAALVVSCITLGAVIVLYYFCWNAGILSFGPRSTAIKKR